MLLGDKVMPSKNYKSLLSDGEEDVVFCGENNHLLILFLNYQMVYMVVLTKI
jgi:hypothetical protein